MHSHVRLAVNAADYNMVNGRKFRNLVRHADDLMTDFDLGRMLHEKLPIRLGHLPSKPHGGSC